MADADNLLNKQQRKKKARKLRKESERAAHRNLDQVTGEAIAQALEAIHELNGVQALDVELASLSEAQFARKRLNEALRVDEWLDEVQVHIWQDDQDAGAAMSASGRTTGIELRLISRMPM